MGDHKFVDLQAYLVSPDGSRIFDLINRVLVSIDFEFFFFGVQGHLFHSFFLGFLWCQVVKKIILPHSFTDF